MFVPQTEVALSLWIGREKSRRPRGTGGGTGGGREAPAAPVRPARLGFVRARAGSGGAGCSGRLPAFSPPPPAPPPGLLLLFNIHLEKLNLASWKPARSQIPGDFQSLSFSPAREATFPLAEAFEKSPVAASPSLAARPDPSPCWAPRGGRRPGRAPEHLPQRAPWSCPWGCRVTQATGLSPPKLVGVGRWPEGDFLEGPSYS